MLEIHTSDLTAKCLRSVQLRHEGKILPTYTTALYRGQLAGCLVSLMHDENEWDAGGIALLIPQAERMVAEMAHEEKRPLSESVKKNADDIAQEAYLCAEHYAARLGHFFQEQATLIGTELPIRWTLEDHRLKKPVHFASHLDLLFRDSRGHMHCWDWKYQGDAPSMAYLGRNLQFALYYMALTYGSVQVDSEFDFWVPIREFTRFAWVDLARFKPYHRKTVVKGREYKKGDDRPMQNIVISWTFSPEQETAIVDELVTRIILMRDDLWPTNPDKRACDLCESKQWCPAFHQDP